MKAEEEEARLKAEKEARLKAEEESRVKAEEEEARLKAEEETVQVKATSKLEESQLKDKQEKEGKLAVVAKDDKVDSIIETMKMDGIKESGCEQDLSKDDVESTSVISAVTEEETISTIGHTIEPSPSEDSIIKYYSLAELQNPIDGVDWAKREKHLSDMCKEDFHSLPKWKQQSKKKILNLF